MAELIQKQSQKANLGEINITTGVLETIASQAASEVDGVVTKTEGGSFISRDPEIQAKVKRNGFDLAIELEINVAFGYSVPEVAIAVQNRVKEQILYMTDLVVREVNVHVVNVIPESRNPEYYHIEEALRNN